MIPQAPSTTLLKKYPSQVAGHDNLLQFSNNDLLVIKPCTQTEFQFYQDAQKYPDFQMWMSECYGSLHTSTESELELLQQQSTNPNEDGIVTVPLSSQERAFDSQQRPLEEHLCLENLLYGFVRPCVLDLKLGKRLYDHMADEKKKEKMIRNVKGTTAETMGIRVSGMRTYDTIEQTWHNYSKHYGRSLTSETLLEALLAYFFPTSVYGRKDDANRESMHDQEAQKTAEPRKKIAGNRMAWVLENMMDQVEGIRSFLASHPQLELISASILMIFEGDKTASDKAWKYMLEEDRREANDDSQDDEDAEDPEAPRMFDLRVIDFAHSRWDAVRKSQDSGILEGLDHLLRLLGECLDRQRCEKL